MTTVADFLRAIFPGTSAGYACLVELPAHPYKTYQERWETPKSTYQAVRSGRPLMINPDELTATSDWFFSPTVYQERQRRRHNAESAKVVWVDFDDPGAVDPLALSVHPTVVVETSPGKFHCYWVLDESLSAINIENLNRKLAYHFGADLSGWDATQIMRLPAGIHSKDPENIFHPRIVFIDLSLVYSPSDFEDIPEPQNAAKTPGEPDMSLPQIPLSADGITKKFKDRLSLAVMECYTHTEPDRSRALWFLAHAAYRAGMKLDECFWWLKGSKNDKFDSLTRGGPEALWRDVQASYRHAAETRVDQSVIAQIDGVLSAKATPLDKKRRVTEIVIQDMMRNGKLFNAKDTGQGYYLQRDMASGSAETIKVSKKHIYFQKLMLTSYALNDTTEEYSYVASEISVQCHNTAPVDLHKMSYFDRANGVLYINRYDGTAYMLDGHTIEVVPNGYRDVFFTNPPSIEPLPTGCELGIQESDHSRTDLWYDLIFPSLNLPKQDDNYPEDIKLILLSWVVSVYFKELIRVKPILFMHGPPGSGKTLTFKALGYTVFGPMWSPYETPSKEETFNHTVAMSDLNVYDNIDSYVSWLPDKLAQASTSYIFSKRKLYSDGDDYRVHVSCFLGLTAFAPKFRRVDVMERMIPVRVVPFYEKLANESIITNRIVSHRRELWRELLALLNAVIRRLATLDNQLPNVEEGLRIGDYLSMLRLVGEEIGQDSSRAASIIRFGQAKEMVEDDPVIYALERWLKTPKNQDRPVTWEILHRELCALSIIGEEIKRKVQTPRGLAIKLGQLAASMKHAGITSTQPERGKHVFVKEGKADIYD